PPAAERLLALLRRLCDEGRTVLLATHDVDAVAPAADRIVALADGRVVAAGPPANVLPRLAAAPAAAPPSEDRPPDGDAPAAPREPPVSVAAGMLGALLLGLGFFLPAPLAARAALAAGLAGLAAAWGLSLPRLARLLRPVFLLALLAGLLHVLTAEGGRTLLAAGPVSVTTAGLAAAAGTVLRVCGPVLAGLAAAGEGSTLRAARGLARLLAALPLGRRVAGNAAVVVMLVARFASLLRTEVARVERAQRARGADRASGTVRQRAYGLVGVLVPVLTGSLERAERLALTLHVRGLRGRGAGAGPAGPLFRRADLPWLLAAGALPALLLALAR
ncbi:MAG TPA: CbiQ family ECF transporter T component, partial [Dehalococcoidia bacterium]